MTDEMLVWQTGELQKLAVAADGYTVHVEPKLVVEICYDHFSGHRFRHGTRLLRWRPDKAPQQCTFDQLAQKKGNLLKLLG